MCLFRSYMKSNYLNTGYLIYDSSFPFLRCFSIAALKTNCNNNYKCRKYGPQHLLAGDTESHELHVTTLRSNSQCHILRMLIHWLFIACYFKVQVRKTFTLRAREDEEWSNGKQQKKQFINNIATIN